MNWREGAVFRRRVLQHHGVLLRLKRMGAGRRCGARLPGGHRYARPGNRSVALAVGTE
ncbi:hypothetical protein BN2497_2321 [Janthinobacterium sp. CG23_2]|nr:hypothetical protein BN2497_2321 [Janthinobacterium sp. CG23_2]CUU27558.1 hypothetical protein BN3177_2321 [Janthinobacterium sp. CG23_2]